jgi:hypothetical protein
VSLTDGPASRARSAPSAHHAPPLQRGLRLRVPARPLASSWHRVRLAVVVRWQSAGLDRELAAGVSPRASDALALRARRITRRRSRVSLAIGLARVLRNASESSAGFTAAVAPDRREVLAARTVIEALESRLRGPVPLTARGMAMLRELIMEPTSPLYRAEEPGALGHLLRAAALEPATRWE